MQLTYDHDHDDPRVYDRVKLPNVMWHGTERCVDVCKSTDKSYMIDQKND